MAHISFNHVREHRHMVMISLMLRSLFYWSKARSTTWKPRPHGRTHKSDLQVQEFGWRDTSRRQSVVQGARFIERGCGACLSP